MNDNENKALHRLANQVELLNIGANGRWFMLALVAIFIAAGMLKLATCAAIVIGLACVLEQLNNPTRTIGAVVVYIGGAILAVIALVTL